MDEMNGNGFWIFALLILLFGANGNGFGFGGANGRVATIEDLNNSSNFTRLENQVRANAELTERKTDAINNGICSLGYEIANKFAQTNELVMAENQKTRDMIQQNKIESLQAQVNELKTQNMIGGIPKVSPYGYGIYAYPTCNCGCGCGGTTTI